MWVYQVNYSGGLLRRSHKLSRTVPHWQKQWVGAVAPLHARSLKLIHLSMQRACALALGPEMRITAMPARPTPELSAAIVDQWDSVHSCRSTPQSLWLLCQQCNASASTRGPAAWGAEMFSATPADLCAADKAIMTSSMAYKPAQTWKFLRQGRQHGSCNPSLVYKALLINRLPITFQAFNHSPTNQQTQAGDQCLSRQYA